MRHSDVRGARINAYKICGSAGRARARTHVPTSVVGITCPRTTLAVVGPTLYVCTCTPPITDWLPSVRGSRWLVFALCFGVTIVGYPEYCARGWWSCSHLPTSVLHHSIRNQRYRSRPRLATTSTAVVNLDPDDNGPATTASTLSSRRGARPCRLYARCCPSSSSSSSSVRPPSGVTDANGHLHRG